MSSGSVTKVLVLGAKAVGKTSLIKSLVEEKFSEEYQPTQTDWFRGSVKSHDGREYDLQFIDTGAYSNLPLTRYHMEVADVFIVVSEYNCSNSAIIAKRIIQDIKKTSGEKPILCVLSKCDLELYQAGQLEMYDGVDLIICSSKFSIGILDVRRYLGNKVFFLKSQNTFDVKNVARPKSLAIRSRPFVQKTLPMTAPATMKTSTPEALLSEPCSISVCVTRSSSPASPGNPFFKGISNVSSLLGSPKKHKDINTIFRKYGYQRRLSEPAMPPIEGIARNIKSRCVSLVDSIQQMLSELDI